MPTGLLEVTGTIDLAQFWPTGEWHADTVKVHLSDTNAFRFTKNPGAAPIITHAFDGAQVHGKVTKDAIASQQRSTIRLQAIDAPELDYRPLAPTLNQKRPTTTQRAAFKAANGNLRQFWGETATAQLFTFLSKAGPSPIKCVVCTQVDATTCSIPWGGSSETSSFSGRSRSSVDAIWRPLGRNSSRCIGNRAQEVTQKRRLWLDAITALGFGVQLPLDAVILNSLGAFKTFDSLGEQL